MLLDFDDFEEDVGFLMILKKMLGSKWFWGMLLDFDDFEKACLIVMILGHAAGF